MKVQVVNTVIGLGLHLSVDMFRPYRNFLMWGIYFEIISVVEGDSIVGYSAV
jgi:hypothetical protein